jgi:hypothetical protein
MPAPSKLKVFRTAIGFHDAYVAAPSQKAALKAWGSESDLFAQKSAELVTEPALMAEPLANPGKVIKRLRGTAAEQIAALGPDRVPRKKKQEIEADADDLPAPRQKTSAPKIAPVPKPKPRPDRSAVVLAEAAIASATERQAAEQKSLRNRQAELDRERRDMERSHQGENEALEETRMRAEAAYDKAMKRWRG